VPPGTPSSKAPDMPMFNRRFRHLLVAPVAAAVLVLPLGASQAQPDQSTVPGKTFAAYEYWWYPIDFVDHFNDPLRRRWEVKGRGQALTQRGMLTLMSSRTGSLGVTLRGHARDRGRWEIRLRGKRIETGNANFTVAAELIPAGKQAQHCGARNIGFASFRPAVDSSARFHIRTLPNRQFTSVKRRMNLSNDYWHTYAVQVTPKRIAWFVDGVARAVEYRRDAISGIPLTLRLQLQAIPGKTMNLSRLQVDTVRYFTLKTPSKKPVRGRLPVRGTYAGAC
jgi:Glycosyl hydrolases family 16